jgi:hypothetical protein
VGDKPAVRRNEKPISWGRLPFATAPLVTSEDVSLQKSRVSHLFGLYGLLPKRYFLLASSLKFGTKTDLQLNLRMNLHDCTLLSHFLFDLLISYHYIACCSLRLQAHRLLIGTLTSRACLHPHSDLSNPGLLFFLVDSSNLSRSNNSAIDKHRRTFRHHPKHFLGLLI